MGNIWGIHELSPHPDHAPHAVTQVTVQLLSRSERSIMLEFCVYTGGQLLLPPEAPSVHTDGLWQATCFEAFLKSASDNRYCEYNFSPSFAWAAYTFDRRREGMRPLPMHIPPEITVSVDASQFYWLSAEFDPPHGLQEPFRMNATAVIVEKDGTKSYWALAHPTSGPPDFHDPTCFVLELPPLTQ